MSFHVLRHDGKKLADRARLRQLINQSVDQLTVAVETLATEPKLTSTQENSREATSLRRRLRTTLRVNSRKWSTWPTKPFAR